MMKNQKNDLTRDDLIDCVPCLACGALPGELCVTLYSKNGREAGKPFAGHHMVRCYMWNRLKALRGQQGFHDNGRPKRGLTAGCYFEVMNMDIEVKQVEHFHGSVRLGNLVMSYNLKKAMSR